MPDLIKINVGDSYPVELTTLLPTGAVDADAAPIWKVRKISDDSLVFEGVFSHPPNETGEYAAAIPFLAASGVEVSTQYRVTGYATVNGYTNPVKLALIETADSLEGSSTPTEGLNLVTLTEVNSYLGLPAPGKNESTDARALIIAKKAEAYVEREIGATFICQSRVESHAGGLPFIEPFVLPIASVTSVLDSYDDDEPADSTDYHVSGDYLLWGEAGGPPYPWPCGFNRWKVTVVSGYNNGNDIAPAGSVAAPSGLKGIVLDITRRFWETRGGIMKESTEKHSVEFDSLSTGETARQLDPFRLKTGF